MGEVLDTYKVGATETLMYFEIIGNVSDIETIASGNSIRELNRLNETYDAGRWRKLKGVATVRLSNGTYCSAEVHWYEAVGIGRKGPKIKQFLD